MKKIGKIGVVAILGVAVVCLIVGYSAVDQGGILIPRDNTETKEKETMLNSPYTVEHKIVMPDSYSLYPSLELTITGPPDNLLVIISDGERESRSFISREQLASGEGKARFIFFGSSGKSAESYNIVIKNSYNITIKKSDIDKNEGETVYKGRIDFQGGSIEVVEVSAMTKGTARVCLHNPGDLPVKIEYIRIYSSKGQEQESTIVTLAPGEYRNITIFCRPGRGEDIRLYVYDSDRKEIAKFEGKIT